MHSAERTVHGVRWVLEADTPRRLSLLLDAFPLLECGHEPPRNTVTVTVGPLTSSPAGAWRDGALGLRYRWEGSARLWLRTTHGSRLEIDRSIGLARVDPAAGETTDGLAVGLSIAVALLCTGRELWPVHAAVVALGERTVVIGGKHGAGKSTQAAILARLGGECLADDLLLLRAGPELSLLPVQRPCAPAPGGREVALRADCAPEFSAQGSPGLTLLLLTGRHGRRTRVVPLNPCQALGRLVALGVMPGDHGALSEHLRCLAELAEQARGSTWLLSPGPDAGEWWARAGRRLLE